jgi:hypothetical protein
MNRILTIWVGAAMMLLASASSSCSADEVFPVVHNEPIAVRVLDGKGGRPQARVRLMLTAGYDRRDLELGLWREEAVTDAEGMARLSDTLRNLPLLRVEVLNRRACWAGTNEAAISVERIRLSGLTRANRCGFASVVSAPGKFTVFVKGTGPKRAEAPAKALLLETVPQAKSEAPTKVQDPRPPFTDDEVAQILMEQN